MSYRITPADVRAKLRMDENEVTDATLNSKVYIPAAEAEVDAILADGSVTYADLVAYKQTLVDIAEILFSAAAYVGNPPVEDFTVGPFESARVKADERIHQVQAYRNEAYEKLLQAGAITFAAYGGVTGGADYETDGVDDSNLNLRDAPDNVSLFS